MSHTLDQLQATLHNVSQVALARMRLGDSLQIAHERSMLIDWLGGKLELEESTGDRIIDALRAFEQKKYISGLRQARLICYGCTQPFGTPPQRLIENSTLFTTLLEYTDQHYHRIRAFRKCYRGLLNSYFSYDPDSADSLAEGRRNLEMLQKFLDKRKDHLDTARYNPEWVAALSTHSNLLGEDPCKPYRLADLEKNLAVFDDIRERLEIGDGSWIVRRIIFSQVKEATALGDSPFKESIDSLLLLLIGHPLYADAALSLLLERYARCDQPDSNTSLRDFSIRLWGNPWLAANTHRWQCSQEARNMVAYWLKHHLTQDFFSILCRNDAGNLRRQNFWELYCEDMQGMYFALGSDAFIRDNTELYKLRHDAKGLIVRLAEERNDIHTLIMQFGQYHVVEFNSYHYPAFFYDTLQGLPPFYLSKGWVDVGALSESKMSNVVATAAPSKPLRHMDTPQLAWEGKFAHIMGATENSITAFCRKYRCRHEDLRSRGGQEWIHPTSQTQCGPEAWSVLLGWGFSLSPNEQGYCRA